MDLRLAPTEAERRPGAGLRVRQIFFLKVRKDFGLQDRDLTFVLHMSSFTSSILQAILSGIFLKTPLCDPSDQFLR